MQALITIKNRPRVSSMSGAVKRAKIGLMIAFSTPKMNATTNRTKTLRAVVGAVRVMPLRIHVAIASAAAVASSLRIHLM
jgi:hypothetical protein